MTKPKKYQYQIQYIDNTYRIVDWTKAEFEAVGKQMATDKKVMMLSDGIFKLDEIRAIVLIPEEPEPEKTEESKEEGQLTEWGFVDQDTAEWLKANGIDLSKGVNN